MKLYSESKDYKLYQGNMLDMLEVVQPNSIDSIVTDPPYGLTSITKRFGKEGSAPVQFGKDGAFSRLSKGFMGKEWDGSGIEYNIETWKKCFEVLKEGGYLLAFGGSRTFHRIACAIEDAGFEIRDTIMWLYGSGFPKSMSLGKVIESKMLNGSANIRDIKKLEGEKETYNSSIGKFELEQEYKNKNYVRTKTNVAYKTELGKKWNGWGTCLKPSFEPIIVARKPFKGSLVDNVIKNGVGGINIDECRVETNGELIDNHNTQGIPFMRNSEDYKENSRTKLNIGRFPANTILTYDETDFEEVCGGFPQSKGASSQNNYANGSIYRGQSLNESSTKLNGYREWYNDSGSASRYFYCAKASKRDRDEGLEEFEDNKTTDGCIRTNQETARKFGANSALRKNIHPTVKPTDLMQYLVRLVTPNGGTILDPFNGSGSTGKAVMYENKGRNKNYKYIGIELTEEYLPIAKARIDYVCNLKVEEDKRPKQVTIFDI